jgi:hypothetical protein
MVLEGLRSSINNVFKRSDKSDNKSTRGAKTTSPKRPGIHWSQMGSKGVQWPVTPRSRLDLRVVSKQELTTRMIIKTIRQEIFRPGIVVEQKFWGKCKQCEKEYNHRLLDSYKMSDKKFKEEGFNCPNCETGKIHPPDEEQKTILEDFVNRANENGQHLLDVCMEIEDDFQIIDDGYLIVLKDYILKNNKAKFDNEGSLHWVMREVVRGDPLVMLISANDRGEIGKELFTCLIHRNFITPDKDDRCAYCGSDEMFPVHYVSTGRGGQQYEQAYIEGEVIHKSKYSPSLLYGYSQILTAYHHITANLYMIQMISDMFRERRVPIGIVAIPSHNPNDVEELAEDWREKTKRDKLYIAFINYDPETGAKPEFIRMFDSLQEIQYSELRKENSNQIGVAFGVEPFFQGDLTGGGGLNNEGLQITVTNRAVASGQRIWNDGIFPELLKAFKITDWIMYLPPSEEEDQMAELERESLRIGNARQMYDMDFEIERTAEGEFIYSDKPKERPEQGFGGTGGLFTPSNNNSDEGVSGDETDNNEGSDEESQGACFERQKRNLKSKHPDWSDKKIEVTAKFNCSSSSGEKTEPNNKDHKSGEPEEPKREITRKYQIFKTSANDLLSTALYNEVEEYVKKIISEELRALTIIRGEENITEDDVKRALSKAQTTISRSLPGFAFRFFSAMYIYGRNSIGMNENDLDNAFESVLDLLLESTGDDPDVVAAFEEQQPFVDAFAGFSLDLSNRLRNIVGNNYATNTRVTVDQLVSQMQNEVTTQTYRLERIARSESQRFVLDGREKGYERIQESRPDELLFTWSVRFDDRTSNQCKEIARRVQTLANSRSLPGIPLKELKEIAIQVQRDMNGPTWHAKDWLIHPNCRSRYIRVV